MTWVVGSSMNFPNFQEHFGRLCYKSFKKAVFFFGPTREKFFDVLFFADFKKVKPCDNPPE